MADRIEKQELEGERKTDIISAIAHAHLSGFPFRASLPGLFTVIQKEIRRRELDIHLYPSLLKGILVAEKRPFCMVRVPDEGTYFTLEKKILLDILEEMSGKKKSKKGKVVDIKSSSLLQKREEKTAKTA